jgi:pimeloyl-ACP methyl ester carboxylesterase
MDPTLRNIVRDLRAASSLTVEAIKGTAGVVEAMHEPHTRLLARFAPPIARIQAGIGKLSFGTIRGVTHLVGHAIDRTLTPLEPLAGERGSAPWFDATLAVLNGVVGDQLQRTGSPLAIHMGLRSDGRPLPLTPDALAEAMPDATGKLLVVLHGSCLDDARWIRSSQGQLEDLASELGYTPVYVRYNTGRHISTNGAELADRLEQLTAAWPVALEQVALLGHSMGGLVARAACRSGETNDHRWRTRLAKLVCVGTPHLGAPYEKLGNWVDIALEVSPYSAPLAKLGKIRSAGVTDLRFGAVTVDDGNAHDRFARRPPPPVVPLPDGVACYALAASLSKQTESKPRDDGLVPVDSALGRGDRPDRTLGFAPENRATVFETGHLGLLESPEVYAILERWLEPDRRDSATPVTSPDAPSSPAS